MHLIAIILEKFYMHDFYIIINIRMNDKCISNIVLLPVKFLFMKCMFLYAQTLIFNFD